MSTDLPEFEEKEKIVKEKFDKLLSIKGEHSVDHIHKELGHVMWDFVGMARNKEGLQKALDRILEVKKEFWTNVRIPGNADGINLELEKAGRLADFIEIGELMARDALNREESSGGHFREEYQTKEGEALRRDEEFAYVSCWEYKGDDEKPELHKEELKFEYVELKTRNYK
jgi:succinate dehydrogenase / fumarate reductase flavoprotein subunit